MSSEISKEEFLRALDAGYEMPPEEAESFTIAPCESQEQYEVLCKYPARKQPAPAYPGHAAKVWALLAPYYDQKASLERDTWRLLARGLSDEDWNEMWRTSYNRRSVARTLELLRTYPVLLDETSHPPPDACDDAECVACSVRDCPFREPSHYHQIGRAHV